MRLPKMITGIAIIGLGGLSSLIPGIGVVIAPTLIKVGEAVTLWGATAKGVRAIKEKSVSPKTIFKHEKEILKGGRK